MKEKKENETKKTHCGLKLFSSQKMRKFPIIQGDC